MTERQFPDAEEFARRNQVHRDLIEYMVTHSPKEQEAREQLNPIVHEHGFDEVYRMLQKISPHLKSSKNPDQDERLLYAEYVELFRRFGGMRPFLTPPENVRLKHERGTLLGRQILRLMSSSGARVLYCLASTVRLDVRTIW